jgi:hypothetical protein
MIAVASTNGKGKVVCMSYHLPKPEPKDLSRFLRKVDARGGPLACWTWTAARYEGGYGCFTVRNQHFGAHRVALAWIGDGDVSERRCVLHSCDNPECVNPEHLRYGTQRDNALDRETRARGNHSRGEAHSAVMRRVAARGERNVRHTKPERTARGERAGGAKLTEADVRAICASTATHAEVGRQYGVDEVNVGAIRAGATWTHVVIDGPRDRRVYGQGDKRMGPQLKRRKLTEEQVREIRASTETNVALAPRYGVTDVTISLIRRGKIRKDIPL